MTTKNLAFETNPLCLITGVRVRFYLINLLIGFMIILATSSTVFAWDDCPKGLVDDPYPGECSRYIDTDNDGLCDHSQLAPEDREPVEEEIVDDVFLDEEVHLIEKQANLSKVRLALLVVITHLLAILFYVNFKKNR